jgi:predicted CoA-substrate-specific enzyme activase
MFAGIDIGSTTIKFVLIDNKEILNTSIVKTGSNPQKSVNQLINNFNFKKLVATGYGRYILDSSFEDIDTISEIKAYAIAVHELYQISLTILDIGGQDIKVTSIDEKGKILKFEMNDKCSAGTGKFLEIMANTLGYSIDELGEIEDRDFSNSIELNSTCTVFAESEVISLLTKGVSRQVIAKAINKTVVKKAISMLNRVGIRERLVFAGGVAKNKNIMGTLKKTVKCEVLIPEEPQLMGALGAALFASESLS